MMNTPRSPKTKAEVLLRAVVAMALASIVGVIAIGAASAAWTLFQKEGDAKKQAALSVQQIETLSSQEEKVRTDLSSLSSDRGAEAALRERYGVAKPGEGVIEIIEPQGSSTAESQETSESWLQRLVHVFIFW